MKVLKYFTKDGWSPLYISAIAKALFAENNLSDILDREEARKNLELTGDNNHTHYHDDRYVPMIDAVKDSLLNTKEELKESLGEHDHGYTLEGPILNLSSKKNGWYKWSGTLDSVSGAWIVEKKGTLYTATNIEDPRVVLNSNDLTVWRSPYGYWHA